ncbi:protein slender lobes [Uranotaenia lowii]|uniref:protein slender lobes n=1 Tax=Uranotaenia lowii TaxID=190385 RepID=UPI00247A3577|nr:protein slender lobes [Uranotaenia lowii]
MNPEEESSTRVTRGALRRRSIDQDTTANTGTPKASTSKKIAPLDPIQETGSIQKASSEIGSPVAVQKPARGVKKETTSVSETKTGRHQRTASISEDTLNNSQDVRRTPRRRPSQDVTVTPQTAPTATRRMTRRNSVTSEDGSLSSLPVTTPKATKSRLSVAPPTITEDDEKEEEKSNSSIAETDLSDLDVRKLRNRSISASPVAGKNTTIDSSKPEDTESNETEQNSSNQLNDSTGNAQDVVIVLDSSKASQNLSSISTNLDPNVSEPSKDSKCSPKKTPTKHEFQPTTEEFNKSSKIEQPSLPGSTKKSSPSLLKKTPTKSVARDPQTPSGEFGNSPKAETPQKVSQSPSKNQLQRSVKFDETGTPPRQNQSSYPKTPVSITSGSKCPKLNEDSVDPHLSDGFEINETFSDSPKAVDAAPVNVTKTTEAAITPEETSRSQSIQSETNDTSFDQSLANVVEDVKQNLNKADISISLLGTPKAAIRSENPKSHFCHIRTDFSSTPIATSEKKKPKDDCSETHNVNVKHSWSPSIKGSNEKGIDVFSVRKQEEEKLEAAKSEKLNESLQKSLQNKSPKKMLAVSEDEDEDGDEEVQASELLERASSEQNSFIDDEAMEVDDYQSGDSMDSETRREMEENEIEDHGETIGSEDSEDQEEESNDEDSFVVSDNESESLLEGTGDDLESEEEQINPKQKKRKRILSEQDSSAQEDNDETKSEKSSLQAPTTPEKSPLSPLKKSSSSKSSKYESPTSYTTKNATDKTRKSLPATCSTGIDSLMVQDKNCKRNTINALEQSPNRGITEKTQDIISSPATKPKKQQLIGDRFPIKVLNEFQNASKSPSHDSVDPNDGDNSPIRFRKSLPTPALIGSDFYSSSANKKSKRHTINISGATDPEIEQIDVQVTQIQSIGMVTNPAALVSAKKKESSVRTADASSPQQSSTEKLKKDTTIFPTKQTPNMLGKDSNEKVLQTSVADSSVKGQVKKNILPKKITPKDVNEFDHEAILNRCNEIVRADKARKKSTATLRQQKKDEKRRIKDTESGENADETLEEQLKKKKKKKKQINYMLEELGETKKEQLARALKRKQALLEAKRERKKAKKAAKLAQQLNKENDNDSQAAGIGAKFDIKGKKKKKSLVEELFGDSNVENVAEPLVKQNISAFAAYKTQIDELNAKQSLGKKKGKTLKDKIPDQSEPEKKINPRVSSSKINKKRNVVKQPESNPKNVEIPMSKKSEVQTNEHVLVDPKQKIVLLHQENSTPVYPTTSFDQQLKNLKQCLSEPIVKVVKKQKMSHGNSTAVTTDVEVTPPRKQSGKLKALMKLESGFVEEPVTPDPVRLKRNNGFREEPVTPRPIGFKVSNVLPDQAPEREKKHVQNEKKDYSKRIRSEEIVEPARGLPLPVWTRSGSFEVEDLVQKTKKPKKSQVDNDYIKLQSDDKRASNFLVKSLEEKSGKHKKKAHQINTADIEEEVLNFKKKAIFGNKNAPLREKKPKC